MECSTAWFILWFMDAQAKFAVAKHIHGYKRKAMEFVLTSGHRLT